MILSGIVYPFEIMSFHKGKHIFNCGSGLVTVQQKKVRFMDREVAKNAKIKLL
jgi:hypothetical protein